MALQLADSDEAVRILHEWHEYYLLLGTAAVTLVGLLFVALSFNLDALLHDRHAGALDHARQTMRDFLVMLLLSLLMLEPGQSIRQLGISFATMGIAVLAMLLRAAWRARLGPSHTGPRSLPVARRAVEIGAYAALGATGIVLIRTRDPEYLVLVMLATFALLANAVGSAWFLLVEVGRIKSRERG